MRQSAKEATLGTLAILLAIAFFAGALLLMVPVARWAGLPGVLTELVLAIFLVLTVGRYVHDRL